MFYVTVKWYDPSTQRHSNLEDNGIVKHFYGMVMLKLFEIIYCIQEFAYEKTAKQRPLCLCGYHLEKKITQSVTV